MIVGIDVHCKLRSQIHYTYPWGIFEKNHEQGLEKISYKAPRNHCISNKRLTAFHMHERRHTPLLRNHIMVHISRIHYQRL